MKLPIYQDENKNFMLMQTNWASIINAPISNPIINGTIINGIVMVSGNNVINHKLNRNLQGYIVIGQNASATFYEIASATPDKTLILNSSGAVKINLYVF